MNHVYQWVYQRTDIGVDLGVFAPEGKVTVFSNHIAMQIIAALLVILVIPRVARTRQTGDAVADLTPRGLGNFFESICAYFRDTLARPVLGEYTDRYIPYIWTAFFYVLFINLLGLLPIEPLLRVPTNMAFPDAHHGIGGTPTGNIWVTATLACCTLFMIVFNGLRINGIEFIKHFFQGPIFIAPLIAFLEVIGLVAKTFALAVRLFANMVAGHVLLAVLASFAGMAFAGLGTAGGVAVSAIVVLVSTAFNFLEIFVAFLQAFIFAFLTTIFIGQAVVIHHHDDHGHHEEHDEHMEHNRGTVPSQ